MKRLLRLGQMFCLLLSLIGLTAEAWADTPVAQAGPRGVPPPPAAERGPVRSPVEVRVMVIHASNSFAGYDRGIVNLRPHLALFSYRGFRLLFQNEMMLRPGTTRQLGLFEDNNIEVTLNEVTWERAVLRVRLFNPARPNVPTLDTLVSVSRRGMFFLAGPQYGGGVLIIPITAWY